MPATADWPEWRGSPRRDGFWTDRSLPISLPKDGPPIVWKASLGSGYSGPAVVASRLYVMDRLKPPLAPVDTERVLCFDSHTGKPLWTNTYPCSVHYPYGYENGPRTTPLVRDGAVYTLGGMGMLSCLDASTGIIRWRHDLGGELKIHIPYWGVGSQPVLSGNLIIVMAGGASNACVAAFDRKSGIEKWRNLGERPSYAPLVTIGAKKQEEVVVWTADGVHGLAVSDGVERWGIPFRCKYDEAVHTPIFDDKTHRIYFPHDWFGTLTVQLDDKLASATLLGTNLNLSMLHSTAVLLDGVIYGVNHNSGDKPGQGELRALDVQSGGLLWKTNTLTTPQRWAQASITYNKGNQCAYILTDLGDLVLARLSRSGFDELARYPLCGKTWSHPAYSDGCIFARAETSLVCARLR